MTSKQKALSSPHTISLRRDILEWRDRHAIAAVASFNRHWLGLRPKLEETLQSIAWQAAIVSPGAYIVSEIDPMLTQSFGPIITELVDGARTELEALINHALTFDVTIAESVEGENHLEAAFDLLEAAAPLVGGIAMGAALPSFAIVSGTTAFGLIATSAVSLPVLAAGIAVVGTALATGVFKSSKLRSVRTDRMLARVDRHVAQSILSTNLAADPPSVLARLIGAYADAADLALKGV